MTSRSLSAAALFPFVKFSSDDQKAIARKHSKTTPFQLNKTTPTVLYANHDDWFLQALSVIPRGSWGDVARRFTMIRWAVLAASLLSTHTPPPPRVAGIRSGRFDEENPFVQNSSVLLVQPDEGVSVLVVDRIGDYLPQSTEKSRVLVIPVGSRHKSENENRETTTGPPPRVAALDVAPIITGHRPPSRATCCAMRRAVTARLARLVRPMMLRRCVHDGRPLHSWLRRWALAGRTKRREMLRDGGAWRVRHARLSGGARPCVACKVWRRRRRRPPLRRCSGESPAM
ncbi:hypothetical protein F511_33356 [Dorcoceras hygrometricum]|uniref:Uncharacterized protein n=1 Tax=Dorcoceras hygrometricum TaxID=472368 RepID=A0A2Z7CZ72_9LAMI|nr:hypothetical protein F511_33356 [Dorcoceras hygrometricum]